MKFRYCADDLEIWPSACLVYEGDALGIYPLPKRVAMTIATARATFSDLEIGKEIVYLSSMMF